MCSLITPKGNISVDGAFDSDELKEAKWITRHIKNIFDGSEGPETRLITKYLKHLSVLYSFYDVSKLSTPDLYLRINLHDGLKYKIIVPLMLTGLIDLENISNSSTPNDIRALAVLIYLTRLNIGYSMSDLNKKDVGSVLSSKGAYKIQLLDKSNDILIDDPHNYGFSPYKTPKRTEWEEVVRPYMKELKNR